MPSSHPLSHPSTLHPLSTYTHSHTNTHADYHGVGWDVQGSVSFIILDFEKRRVGLQYLLGPDDMVPLTRPMQLGQHLSHPHRRVGRKRDRKRLFPARKVRQVSRILPLTHFQQRPTPPTNPESSAQCPLPRLFTFNGAINITSVMCSNGNPLRSSPVPPVRATRWQLAALVTSSSSCSSLATRCARHQLQTRCQLASLVGSSLGVTT